MSTEVPAIEPPSVAGARCVVTGGYGFIGSNLVRRLVASGATVTVVDALVPEHGGDVRNLGGVAVDALVADIGDAIVGDALRGTDLVFNLAGQVSHEAAMADPETDLHHNAVAQARFLATVLAVCPTARLVHTSTRQVYGVPERLPVDERHPTRPVDPNGVAKLAGEQLYMVAATADGLRATALRLSNVYGPRQRLTSDTLGVLPVFVRTALEGGTFRLFGDGSQRRDCVHVDDVVDALVVVAVAERGVGKVYNVGHPQAHSLHEMATMLCELAAAGSVQSVPWPPQRQRFDIGSVHVDSTLIADELGWRAGTGLRQGMAATLAFYREHPWYRS